MPRVCTVCSHPSREDIDAALIAGESNRRIAAQYSLSEPAVRRHKADHLPAKLAEAHQAEEVASAERLIGELDLLKRKAIALLTKAEQTGDLRTALSGVREARGCIETLLEVEGEISRRAQMNVLVVHPEWLAIRTAIMDALSQHPTARTAVIEALTGVEPHAAD